MKRGYNSEVAKQSFLPKVFAVFGLVTILYKYQLHNHRRRQERAAVVTKKLKKVQLGQRDKLILVVDIGSSSVRCNPYIIHDGTSNSNIEKLSPVRLSQFGIQIHHDLFDGSGRTDADTVFRLVVKVIDDTVRCLRGRVAAAGRGGAAGGGWAVAGLGFAVFGGTLVGLGAGGVGVGGGAVTPLFTYAEQSAGVASAAKALRAKVEAAEGLGIDHLFQRTGCPIHPAYASSQLWHLRTEEPSQWARVTKWQTLGSYIIASLTGESVCPISYCEASWTGLFDIWESQWERNLQRLLQIPDYQLAELCDPQGTYFVGLSNIFEKKWPELAQVKIYPAIVDGAAATIGSYCHEQNRYAVTIGTSAAIRVILSNSSVLEQKGIPRGLWCYRLDSQRLILGGSLTDGGSLIQWMLRTFCQTEVERSRLLAAAEALARARGPGRAAAGGGGGGGGSGGSGGGGGHGITLLPFLAGERAPGWNDEATGSIFGLKRTTKPAELVLAGMESICFRLKIIFDSMQQGLETTLKSQKSESQPIVVASGGALSQSTAWRQALADSLGMPVAVLEGDGEATSRGVAITLMEMLSMGSDGENELHFKSINRGSSLCFHDEEDHAASLVVYPQGFDYYLDSIQEQINLYEKLYGK